MKRGLWARAGPTGLGGLRGAPDLSVPARRSLGEVRDLPQVQGSSWLQDRRRGARAGRARQLPLGRATGRRARMAWECWE